MWGRARVFNGNDANEIPKEGDSWNSSWLTERREMSSGGEKAGGGSVKTPADFLKSIRGRPVVVKLNSGVDYRGMVFFFPSHADPSLRPYVAI